MYSQKKYLIGLLFAILLSGTACTKDKEVSLSFPEPIEAPPVEEEENEEEEPLINLPEEWKMEESLMSGFPEGIEVYRNTSPFNKKSLNAYCVVFDPKVSVLEFKPVLASSAKKPSVLFAEEEGTKYACINGGFFGANVSYSLVQQNNEIAAVNIQALTRPYNGSNTTYYPTRGAFGLTAENVPEVSWIYHIGSGKGSLYSYPAPSPNKLNSAPQPQPSASFPEGGISWQVRDAIGGSPVLIKNNVIALTDEEELIVIDNASSRARSAVGHTADGKVVLLAVEGNNPDGGAGLNLQELAELMHSMGCTDALNLDGGGSSYMVVNGKETIKPSASGGERAVMSVVFVKKK